FRTERPDYRIQSALHPASPDRSRSAAQRADFYAEATHGDRLDLLMNYQIIKTADELRKAIETLATQPVVGLDTETTDLDPFTSRLRLIQLATADRVFIIDFDHFANGDSANSEALAPLRRLLEAPRPIKIAHNA